MLGFILSGGWKLLAGIGAILGGWLAWRGQRQAGREDAIRDLDLRRARSDLDAVNNRAESDRRVTDAAVVSELRRRHTRPE